MSMNPGLPLPLLPTPPQIDRPSARARLEAIIGPDLALLLLIILAGDQGVRGSSSP